MPSSVTDRFSNKYEPVYMLVKSNNTNYYYNIKTGQIQRDKPLGTKGEEGIDWDWKEVGSDYSKSDTKIHADDAENLASPRARVYREKKTKKVSNWVGRDYWFDLDAVRKPYTEPMNRWGGQKLKASGKSDWDKGTGQESYRDRDMRPNPLGKNLGDVWVIPTQPYSEAHFATFPTALIKPMIKAACPAEICPVCGLARERITETEYIVDNKTPKSNEAKASAIDDVYNGFKRMEFAHGSALHHTTGWTSCNCGAKWIAGTVLDPFAGSGTVGEVARNLNRNAILLELNPEYGELIAKRTMIRLVYIQPPTNWGTSGASTANHLEDIQ
jgi:hypothetical protein